MLFINYKINAGRDEVYKSLLDTERVAEEEKYDTTKKPDVVIKQTPTYGTKANTNIAVTIYVNSYKGDGDE